MMKRIFALLVMSFVAGPVAADLRSDGASCYRSGDVICATDKLTEFFQTTQTSMEGRDRRPTSDAQILIQSLILLADNTAPGASLSRIEAVIGHVNRAEPETVWFRIALHTLRAEQCAAIGRSDCLAESREIIQANSDNWLMPDLYNSRSQSAFNRRVLAQLRG